MQINKVEDLKINKKYFIFIFKIELGIKSTKEKIADKHSEEKPINEIICIFFSTDYFFLILSLWTQAYIFHHVWHKLLRQ